MNKNEKLVKVARHPLHQFLGATTIASEEGVGKLSIRVTDSLVNPAGIFHGGVIYILADVCAYSGLLSLLDSATDAVTHDIQVSVMRSAKKGDVVDFESKVLKLGGRLCFMEVNITVAEQMIAKAMVTKSLISAQM